ncbi:MAG TPA: 50S ribosomal protein L25 [Solirubrobacteraceae bacterium]|nr:50S ribosomal protein L25 [Solirubrobacteraceae bacterium]
MARTESTALKLVPREAGGSREARRLRREGNVPGVLYGGGGDPVSFQVSARVLRHALSHGGAVLDLNLQGGDSSPAVVKEIARHPVSGETMHIDLLRVRLDQKIQSTVVLELVGVEDAPGVKDGGVLEHVARELTIEALPNDIPDSLTHDVSEMQINDTVTLEALKPPSTVTLVDDPETVIATLTPPRLQVEAEEEIEAETAVVGEGEAAPEGEGEGEGEAEAGEAAEQSDGE